jgi:hypothetical protein
MGLGRFAAMRDVWLPQLLATWQATTVVVNPATCRTDLNDEKPESKLIRSVDSRDDYQRLKHRIALSLGDA